MLQRTIRQATKGRHKPVAARVPGKRRFLLLPRVESVRLQRRLDRDNLANARKPKYWALLRKASDAQIEILLERVAPGSPTPFSAAEAEIRRGRRAAPERGLLHFPTRMLDILARSRSKDRGVRERIAAGVLKAESFSVAHRTLLSPTRRNGIRSWLARELCCLPLAAQKRMMRDPDAGVRDSVVRRTGVASSLLDDALDAVGLSQDEAEHAWRQVAGVVGPEHEGPLRRLLDCGGYRILQRLARNVALPPWAVQEICAGIRDGGLDRADDVALTLSSNPNLQDAEAASLLEISGRNDKVRQRLAKRQTNTPETWVLLVCDPSEAVETAAAASLAGMSAHERLSLFLSASDAGSAAQAKLAAKRMEAFLSSLDDGGGGTIVA